jgi:protein-S-isoprenylcysteine O-methyltransferase Ste14
MMRPIATSGAVQVSPLVPWGRFFFRYRNAIFPLVLAALFVGFRPVYPYGSERLDGWLDLLGIAVALAGQGLRAAVIGYAYIKRGGKHKQVYANRLVTEGFFALSRNPLYLGNLLILLGLFVLHNNPWVYLLGMAFFLFAYRSIVAAEESYLGERFGEQYVDYCHRVNRWLPDFRGLRRSIAGMPFVWRRVVTKEYGSTYAWCATALLLLAYQILTYFAYEERRSSLNALALLLILLTVTWAMLRHLKRSRRLTE